MKLASVKLKIKFLGRNIFVVVVVKVETGKVLDAFQKSFKLCGKKNTNGNATLRNINRR